MRPSGRFCYIHTIKHTKEYSLVSSSLSNFVIICLGYPPQFLAKLDPTVPPPPHFLFGSHPRHLHLVLLKQIGLHFEQLN
jgi:hypothetical protein